MSQPKGPVVHTIHGIVGDMHVVGYRTGAEWCVYVVDGDGFKVTEARCLPTKAAAFAMRMQDFEAEFFDNDDY